jgi:phosphoglycerate dehydrogenase-like enzyme
MKVLFAAPENAWGGFLGLIRKKLPKFHFEATGRFGFDGLKGYDILIPTMTTITRSMLAESDQLKLIQQCGSGLEGVDLQAARELGIRVANVPTDISGNADSVAELGIYLMIGLARDVRGMNRNLSDRKMGEPQGRALVGQIVGLIGLGGIGRALVHRLKPFGVRLIGIKQREPEKAKAELGLEWVGGPADLPELLARSDFVIVCLPLSPENKHLINTAALAAMKPEAFIVNLSRGGLIDRDALQTALAAGKIAGAGLDVFWDEPPDPHDPIFSYNVLATPHIAGSTDHSMRGIVRVVAENIQRIAEGQQPLYVRNF